MRLIILTAIALVSLGNLGIQAQTTPAPVAPAAASVAQTPQAASFAAAVNDYKKSHRAIEDLRSEFQVAPQAQRESINQRLKTLVDQTQPKVNTMVEAAIEAYKANPGSDKEVTKLLLTVVEYQMVGQGAKGGGDDYEAALPILEALIAGGHDKQELPAWAFFAAIVTNQHDLADKYAALCEKPGAFEPSEGSSQPGHETLGIARSFFAQRAQARKQWETEAATRAAEAEADDLPRVKMVTSKGEIVIELFENEAPTAVANFITLVKKGYYDDIVFHRVLSRFMAQGGDPTGSGSGGPGYNINCECSNPGARKHFRGTLSMAHAGPNTGGSQFFLTFLPTGHLDGQHTVYGRVIEGFGVLGALNRVNPGAGGPAPDKIISAEVIRDRGHAYEFDKHAGR